MMGWPVAAAARLASSSGAGRWGWRCKELGVIPLPVALGGGSNLLLVVGRRHGGKSGLVLGRILSGPRASWSSHSGLVCLGSIRVESVGVVVPLSRVRWELVVVGDPLHC